MPTTPPIPALRAPGLAVRSQLRLGVINVIGKLLAALQIALFGLSASPAHVYRHGSCAGSAATDAHVDHFATFNLFGGTKGPYWSLVNAWHLGSLTNSDYSLTITNFTCLFPNQTVMRWSFPSTTNAANVYAYPEIVYGSQAGGGFIVPLNTPPAKTISSFSNLSVTYTVTATFTTSDDADFLIETWVQTAPGNPATNVNEVGFLAHTPAANLDQVLNGLSHSFDYSSGGFNARIAANADNSFIVIMPVTTAGGTTPRDMIAGTQTIPLLGILQALVTEGYISGTNYISGYEFGFEVAKNNGSVLVHDIKWTWN